MKERLAHVFPIAVAAVLPVAGLVLAGARFAEGERDLGARLLIAALLGGLIWTILLTA